MCVIHMGGGVCVCALRPAQEKGYFCKSIAIQMGGASRCFSEVSWSGVDTTLLNPAISGQTLLVSKVGNPFPALIQPPATRIWHALLVGEEQHKIARARFVHRVAQ